MCPFFPHPRPLIRLLVLLVDGFCLAKLGLRGDNLSTLKIRTLFTRIMGNLHTSPQTEVQVHAPQFPRKACVRQMLWTSVGQATPLLSSPVTHQLHRCRPAPQMIEVLCLGCNSSIRNEPQLKELNPQDPRAGSRTFLIQATQPRPLPPFQLSPASTINGKTPNRSRPDKSAIFASHITPSTPMKLIGTVSISRDPKMEPIQLIC